RPTTFPLNCSCPLLVPLPTCSAVPRTCLSWRLGGGQSTPTLIVSVAGFAFPVVRDGLATRLLAPQVPGVHGTAVVNTALAEICGIFSTSNSSPWLAGSPS